MKIEHLETQMNNYELKIKEARKYQSLFSETKMKNNVLQQELEDLKIKLKRSREKEENDTKQFKMTIERYSSQVKRYQSENLGLEKFQQLYTEIKRKNELCEQQIEVWKEKERKENEIKMTVNKKRALDRAKLKEQLRVYEQLLDTGK